MKQSIGRFKTKWFSVNTDDHIRQADSLGFDWFLFTSSFCFYALLWFANPGNKIIIILMLVFTLWQSFRLKNPYAGIFVGYIVSLAIVTGKTYEIQLISKGIFRTDWWPNGYVVFLVISSTHIITISMLYLCVKRAVSENRRRFFRFSVMDAAVFLYTVWQIVTNVFASAQPIISLGETLLSLHGVIVYWFIRVMPVRKQTIIVCVVSVFAAFVLFESFVSVMQFIASSPLGKNIESQRSIEDFGEAVDEIAFRFRPVGTFVHANMLAGILVFFLPLFWSLFVYSGMALFLCIFLLGFITLIMTLGRSAWIAFFFSFLLMTFIEEKVWKMTVPGKIKRYVLSIGLLSIILLLVFILPRAEKSLYTFSDLGGGGYVRQQQIENAFSLIVLHPIMGVGALMSVPEGLRFDPTGVMSTFPTPVHNAYLLIAAEHGIPALLFFLLFMLFYVRKTIRLLYRRTDHMLVSVLALSLLAGVFAQAIVSLFHPYRFDVFSFLAAAVLYKIQEDKAV